MPNKAPCGPVAVATVMLIAAAIGSLLAASPSLAAVYEVGADGTVERLDVVPVRPQLPVVISTSRNAANARVFQPVVARAAAEYEVSPALVDAIAHVESRYNPHAVSPAKAVGIMQLMPGTARDLGVDPRDAAANIRGGTAYLRQLLNRFDGDVVRTIAAYNAGPGAVAKAGGVPNYRETRAYVSAVLDRLAASAQ